MSLHDCDEKQHCLLRVLSSTIVQLPPPKCRKYLFHVALTTKTDMLFICRFFAFYYFVYCGFSYI